MITVKVSPKFQVVIPKEIRSRLSICAGDRLQMIPLEGRIELVPLRSAKRIRGIAKEIDTSAERERLVTEYECRRLFWLVRILCGYSGRKVLR